MKSGTRSRAARPIASATPVSALTWSRPLACPGVPTQMRASSEASTASSALRVARRRPERTTCSMRVSRPGSTMGDKPSLIEFTFSWLTSTPTTWCPALAKQAADTQPT